MSTKLKATKITVEYPDRTLTLNSHEADLVMKKIATLDGVIGMKWKVKLKKSTAAPKKNVWKNSKDLMTSEKFIELLRKDKRRHINLIAEYADEQKVCFETKGQWYEFIARNLRYATKLAPFDDNQISDAMKQIKSANYLEKYTLETLHKFLVK